jgi:hypothetical protein
MQPCSLVSFVLCSLAVFGLGSPDCCLHVLLLSASIRSCESRQAIVSRVLLLSVDWSLRFLALQRHRLRDCVTTEAVILSFPSRAVQLMLGKHLSRQSRDNTTADVATTCCISQASNHLQDEAYVILRHFRTFSLLCLYVSC